MTTFKLPFTIDAKPKDDFLLSRLYEEKVETYVLKVKAGARLSKPITLKMNPTVQDLHFCLKVILEEGANAAIIEDWSPDVASENVKLTHEIICGENSQLKYVALNHASNKTNIEEQRSSDIAASASCHIYAYHFGSKKVQSGLLQKASGAASEIQTNIVARVERDQELNFKAEHLYAGKQGLGEIGMKGVAQDKGILAFDGLVNIAQTGGGSAGYLNQETLNLSPNTVVKAVPGLKIDTNDVKAGHGASVRNLNDEDLYYFGARGIGEEEAKRLLITGFLGKEIAKIKELTPAYETIRKLI